MFYAIEYAYGSTVVNNGPRGDTVYEFTAKRLRDAWVAAGPPDISASGYRDKASARHPLVRNALRAAIDGDSAAWYELAVVRVDASPRLAEYRYELVGYDWGTAEHYRSVAQDSERELIAWAKATRADAE